MKKGEMIMFREIRTREKMTEKDQQRDAELMALFAKRIVVEEEGYKKIKPQQGMTKEEADKFWDERFDFNKRIKVD